MNVETAATDRNRCRVNEITGEGSAKSSLTKSTEAYIQDDAVNEFVECILISFPEFALKSECLEK